MTIKKVTYSGNLSAKPLKNPKSFIENDFGSND